MMTKIKKNNKLIKGYLQGNQREYFEITGWIELIVKNDYWGLREYWDDIIQDVRIKVYLNLKLKRFRHDSDLKTYVCRIAKYTCIDHLRKSYQTDSVHIDSDQLIENEDYLLALIQKENETIVNHILMELPELCRQILQLVFIESLSYKKISSLLNIAEGTVKSRVSRCIGKAVQLRKNFS